MPDNIERTIYKLEVDGSAYVDGVERVSAATKKLSEAQEIANKKLIELQAQQRTYEVQLTEVNTILKENDKETIELTKQLNALKDAEKGTSAEAKNLQSQLRGIATNTKEFKSEAAGLKTNLASTTIAIKDQTKQIAALEPATGGAIKGFTKMYSGLRIIANIIPGIGIGGLVALIAGPLVTAVENLVSSLSNANNALNLMKLNQQNVNDVMEEASKSAGKEITDLKILYTEATNVNLPMKERLKAVTALQQEFPEYFKNLSKEAILNGEAKTSYDELAKSILATARATAAKGKIDQLEAQQLEQDFEKQKVLNATNAEFARASKAGATTLTVSTGRGAAPIQVSAEQNQRIQKQQIQDRKDARLKEIDDQKKLLQAQEDFLIAFAGQTDIANVIETKNAEKAKTTAKEVSNVYEQELQKLKADIAKLDQSAFTDEASITKTINEGFKIREQALDKALKDHQLTAGQLASLKSYLSKLQELTLSAQIDAFHKQKQNYLQAITDEINSLNLEESTRRILSIQDSFERERQTIIAETDRSVQILKQKHDKDINEIVKNAPAAGLTKADIDPQIKQIEDAYSKLLSDLTVIKNQKLEELAFTTFEKVRQDAKQTLDAENLGISEGSLARIQEEAALFQQGKISWEEYQKALTKISKDEANKRFEAEKKFLQQEIQIRQVKITLDKSLTDDQVKQLQAEILRLQQQLVDAEKGNITAENNKPDTAKKKVDDLSAYANAIGSVVDSVIGFWQAANDAEEKSLDRSIALEERRVNEAQKIAERGNATYLKEETDKLNELNLARENAARRQIAINAALEGSQVLVAITGAVSKLATPGIGIAETIAEIAVIIGALATGFGLVKQLESNQPRLYKGTKYLNGPDGIDTIPVKLTRGEAVIPQDKNEAYHPAISAIYDGSIPAKEINEFVQNYHTIKPVIEPSYDRIRDAAEMKITHDDKMAVALSEQNHLLRENSELQKQTLKAIKKMGVNVNIDRKGFAMSFLEVAEQLKKDKRV
jgi:hypothetical protein